MRRSLVALEADRGPLNASVQDITDQYAVFGVMGPQALPLLSEVFETDLSDSGENESALSFGWSRTLDFPSLASTPQLKANQPFQLRGSRVTYVGEPGLELYVPAAMAPSVWQRIESLGGPLGLAPCGYRAMNSLRIEKGYREWSHDLTPDDTPIEAGLSFAVDMDKEFQGREVVAQQLQQRRKGKLPKRLVHIALKETEGDPSASNFPPLLYHDEPVWLVGANGDPDDSVRVGHVTSGAYGHTLKRSMGLAYLEWPEGVSKAFINQAKTQDASPRARTPRFEVEVGLNRYPVDISLRPFLQ